MATERWTDEMLDKLAEKVEKNAEAIEKNAEAIEKLTENAKELNIRFNAYQQTSQWVVNLAFGLLATATITTIITAVFKK
ncbi:hypothetical protein H6S82_27880 [Planktothrix sp. FACHB-1355]|uniref:Uncharacterized protein n=1 Tax=Aerosakkonema funiforme FACHB-1375 TaxID=2949571 RepID=A0A926VD65_9CYAN|nr:hypothetical protein [Aerosakkonema funiforme FACHB-1375]MBD3562635.1 hypothetical protein [Planktothrix sp. FACHB-1355]